MNRASTVTTRTLAGTLAAGLACAGLVASLAQASSPAVLTFITNSRTLNPTIELANSSGGSVRALGTGTGAIVAPNGQSVAVVQQVPPADNATSELIVYPTSGGAAVKIYHCGGFLGLYGWSPDSKLILASCPHGLNDSGPLLAFRAAGGSAVTLAKGVIEGASFAPNSSGDVVFALAKSQLSTAPVNLFVNLSSGGPALQITHDGHDLSPVWGPKSIIFARSKSRGSQYAPINQLWSVSPSGGTATQLTHMNVGPLAEGLLPLALSANGKHLLAGFTGTDQSGTWAVDLSSTTVVPRQLSAQTVPDAISRNGQTVLFTKGFEGAPTSVESVPWGGGKPTVLAAHAANASWNE
jgi:hypothetical protein